MSVANDEGSFIDKNGRRWSKEPNFVSHNEANDLSNTDAAVYNCGLQKTLNNRLDAFQAFCDERFISCIMNATNERGHHMSLLYERASLIVLNSNLNDIDVSLINLLGSPKKALCHLSNNVRYERFVRLSKWVPFDIDEICGIIGFVLLMGVRKQRTAPIREALSVRGTRIFSFAAAGFATTRHRFWQFCRYFSVATNDQQNETLIASNCADNYHTKKITHITQIVLENIRNTWKPHRRVCVDEQMVGFRGRTKMKQYMQNKPDKYGLKIWTLADEKHFVYNFQLYTGKRKPSESYTNIAETNGNTNNEANDDIDSFVEAMNVDEQIKNNSAITREVGLSQRVVMDMINALPVNETNFHLTTDRYFTSLALANKLFEKNITLLGTLDSRKREIPNALKSLDALKRDSESRNIHDYDFWSLYAFHERNTLLSFKTKKAKKITYMFSTQHHSIENKLHTNKRITGTSRETMRPSMIVDYNQSKGFVDNCNRMLKLFTCQRIYRKWTLVYFSRLVDICALNAYICWNSQRHVQGFSDDKRYKFLVAIAMGLIANHAKRVYNNPRTPQIRKRDIEVQFNLPRAPNAIRASSAKLGVEKRRYRCQLCPSKPNRKTRYACKTCDRFVCVNHAIISYEVECNSCNNNYESQSDYESENGNHA
ncbi:piggyBac transposable element-derived protein 4-like protein [Leptotrombidium deliense]|uniref:PiggyBac transposable element-derived protein 4-like protein n=1 Tax=Leptotrombidium deliense TaxID=299467 RepID=A0A443SKP3_9ACAR|nr:piggyBac transposable element-derived protein 4-like protein [Leptotrombidium deliense]